MVPSFCPNPACIAHNDALTTKRWYVRDGTYFTIVAGSIQRFRCLLCGRNFSSRTFSIDFMVKRALPYHLIFSRLNAGSGIRSIARDLSVTHKSILNRADRLARQAIALHARLLSGFSLAEDLATDGFESFVGSQYFPNNIHLLAGTDSQFLHTLEYAHLKRKGRMREGQKRRNRFLLSRPMSGWTSISRSFARVVEQIEQLVEGSSTTSATVYSDEKQQYATCISRSPTLQRMRQEGSFAHVRISSRKARTTANRLFSVNYLDRQIRKDCANHVRETVQYSRDASNCMGRLAIYRAFHNYWKPYRIDDKRQGHLLHAEVAGIERARVGQEKWWFFSQRQFLSRLKVSWSDLLIWLKAVGTPLRLRSHDVAAYAWA